MPKSLAAIVLVLLIAAAAYWLFAPHDEAFVPSPTPVTPVTAPVASTPTDIQPQPSAEGVTDDAGATSAVVAPATPVVDESIVTPPPTLDASDALALAAVTQLNPDVAQWLLPEEQVRKWVALINLLADGKVPVKDRPLEYPLPAFQVQKKGDTLWMDRTNYRRATVLIKALSEMPPSQVARHYQAWLPLFEQAQNELGNGKQFGERLDTAINRIMAVRPLTGDIELQAGVLKYTYANPTLEQASALEKMLWRLGPSNTLRIQNYLRDLAPLL